jgi:hypothetical protein
MCDQQLDLFSLSDIQAGIDEILTVTRLGLPKELRRSLRLYQHDRESARCAASAAM